MRSGSRFGPSETDRGLRKARRIQRRLWRWSRYANGVTFCTARSILSATLVKAVMARGARNYRTHGGTAMRGQRSEIRGRRSEVGDQRSAADFRPPHIALPRLHDSV